MPNTFGHLFRITSFGESHGAAVGVIVDGCPPRIAIDQAKIQAELDRRRPGQSALTTPRDETDTVEILSGVTDGLSTGTPIAMLVRNRDARPSAYSEMAEKFRPSHADFTYVAKYGHRASSGGGRSSARETIARVAGAAIAQAMLAQLSPNLKINAAVRSVGEVGFADVMQKKNTDQADADFFDENGFFAWKNIDRTKIDSHPTRCPAPHLAEKMAARIIEVRSAGDSIGGIVEAAILEAPLGLGEPVFDRLEADLAKAMLSLPATKGFEIGSGFAGTAMTGSSHNDEFFAAAGAENVKKTADSVATFTNNSGGVQGGISNGMPIIFRVAFKPTATIMSEQKTVDTNFENTTLKGRGRHDACVLPRAAPIVEAMSWLVLADHFLRQRAIDW